MSIEEQIKLLIALQRLDSQIFKLKKELENQPLLLNSLEEGFKEKEATLNKKEEGLKAVMVKRKEKEVELGTKEEGIRKLQMQLYQIKTNKEYQAMENQIASQKADVSLIEEDIIKLLDQIDASNKEVVCQKEALNQERKVFEEEKRKLGVRTEEINADLERLTAEREGLSQNVDKEYLMKYERILYSKEGLAMVGVQGDACGGCNINLPPQVINEIKMNQELIFCGSCARILYIEEKGET